MQAEELVTLAQEIRRQRTKKQAIELKAANKGCPIRLYDTLSSFSNQDSGGIIIFGIDSSSVICYESIQSQLGTLQRQTEQREIRADAISGCLFALQNLDLLQVQFADALWNAAVESLTVYAEERLTFSYFSRARQMR